MAQIKVYHKNVVTNLFTKTFYKESISPLD